MSLFKHNNITCFLTTQDMVQCAHPRLDAPVPSSALLNSFSYKNFLLEVTWLKTKTLGFKFKHSPLVNAQIP